MCCRLLPKERAVCCEVSLQEKPACALYLGIYKGNHDTTAHLVPENLLKVTMAGVAQYNFFSSGSPWSLGLSRTWKHDGVYSSLGNIRTRLHVDI